MERSARLSTTRRLARRRLRYAVCVEDDYTRLRRLRLETELSELRLDLERVVEERLRLVRKNEALTAVLGKLLADPRLDEATSLAIEDAMAFDGRETATVPDHLFHFDLSTSDPDGDPDATS